MSTKKVLSRECSISMSSNEYSSLCHHSGTPRTTYTSSSSDPIPLDDDLVFHKRPTFWFKVSMIMVLLVILTLAAIYYENILNIFGAFILWIEEHPVDGIIAYLAFCILWLVCFLPETVLTVGAGFVFTHIYGTKGIVIAVVIVFVGSQLGMMVAFLNGRYLMRQCTERLAAKYATLLLVDQIVEQHGLKMTLILRLTPLTPYNVMNYFMGITSISMVDYVAGNFGILPDCVMMSFVGSFLSSISQIGNVSDGLSDSQRRTMLIFTICGTVAAVLLFVWMTVMAKREFYKMSAEMHLGRKVHCQSIGKRKKRKHSKKAVLMQSTSELQVQGHRNVQVTLSGTEDVGTTHTEQSRDGIISLSTPSGCSVGLRRECSNAVKPL